MNENTKIVHAGRHPKLHSGMVNTPVYRSSTVLFPTYEDFQKADQGKPFFETSQFISESDFSYGITGTPTGYHLQEAIAELENGEDCIVFPSGLAAITNTILALVDSGDHVLMVDSVYGPTRRFCHKELKRFGVETTYYDPLVGKGIVDLVKKNTKVIFMESPGSLTFELQDIEAIVGVAKSQDGIVTIMDNSWATPLYLKPLDFGVDVSIMAGTKYIGGHSDVMVGFATTKDPKVFKRLFATYRDLGTSTSPDDCYLAARGLRTLSARLKQHEKGALELAGKLQEHSKVSKVLHPALGGGEQGELYQKYFKGSSGLFSIVLDKEYTQQQVAKMFNSLKYFGIGVSWGGYESLILHFNPRAIRSATKWREDRTCIRLYVGLEDIEDLYVDFEHGLACLDS